MTIAVSGLRRGTAGTGVYTHSSVNDSVTDVGSGEQLPTTYQQKTTQLIKQITVMVQQQDLYHINN